MAATLEAVKTRRCAALTLPVLVSGPSPSPHHQHIAAMRTPSRPPSERDSLHEYLLKDNPKRHNSMARPATPPRPLTESK
ncbi:hypothetical protein E2C01_064296 [Portunus trituberculatus]|uniref:Uncharacterized protein n=1 Tax=Portunus trituberculatus TaxID=210409 RepID=A0A5B7HCM2_PORTR|nr:hypothetical protein [Portunus trituberculatus]